MVRGDDGVYAYHVDEDADGHDNDVKSVWLLRLTADGDRKTGYFISCRKNGGELIGSFSAHKSGEEMLMVEGNAKPTDPGWVSIPESGEMKLASDILCLRDERAGARVDSEQAAIKRLKMLSN